MSASSGKSKPSELTAGDLSAMPGNDGRTIDMLTPILGIGGFLTSQMIVGGILGVFGIVLGVITMVKAMSAKKRVQAAGEEAAIGGSFGLGIVGIVAGIAAVVVSLMLYASTSDATSEYKKYEHTTAEYAECTSKQMSTDQLKDQQQQQRL